MAGPLGVSSDMSVGDWLQDALPFDGTVAGIVPAGFDAYARVQHPATLHVPTGEVDAWGGEVMTRRAITWDEAASLVGEHRTRPAFSAWAGRFGDADHIVGSTATLRGEPVGGGRVGAPHMGDVEIGVLAALAGHILAEHGDADVAAAVWEGRGLDPSTSAFFMVCTDVPHEEAAQMRREHEAAERQASIDAVDREVRWALRHGPLLELPGRTHVLLRGQLATFADASWQQEAGLGWRGGDWAAFQGRTPNLLWPVTEEPRPPWSLGADVDDEITYVAGSRALIDRILADPSLDAHPAQPTDALLLD